MEGFTLTEHLLSRIFTVQSLAYAHSCARPVPSLTSTGYGLPPTTTISATCQESYKYRASVAPRTPYFCYRDVCSHHTESNALPTEVYGTGFLKLLAFSKCASLRVFICRLFLFYDHFFESKPGFGTLFRQESSM